MGTRSILLLVLSFSAATSAIDARWTPNGEGPAPYSTKARQQMGMDPGAFAGQGMAPPRKGGATLGFSLGMLLTMYLANNWKVVEALRKLLFSIIAPLLGAVNERRSAAAADAERLQLETARLARLERLKAKASNQSE